MHLAQVIANSDMIERPAPDVGKEYLPDYVVESTFYNVKKAYFE